MSAPPRSRLARLLDLLGALMLMLTGVLMLIASGSGMRSIDIAGAALGTESTGLLVLGSGIVLLFASGRRVPPGDDDDER